jgi:protocatechuate 3,4-dioxygenase beta subunit
MNPNPKKSLSTASLTRRQLVFLLQGTFTATLAECFTRQASSKEVASPGADFSTNLAKKTPSCIVRPEQMEGPYFVEEKLNRSDIRIDTSNKLTKEGAGLYLTFYVSQFSGGSCSPLAGATVDLWHCDASGVYSDVQDRSFDTRGKNFLRGSQITNKSGIVQFTTIYPGWYPGRTVHIHFKIRAKSSAQKSYEFTSQLYFDDSVTDRIHSAKIYKTKGPRTVRNNQDGIYQDGGKNLTLQLSKSGGGYAGRFDIGIQMS